MTGGWWACPACGERVWAVASEVGHRCPKLRQNAWQAWRVDNGRDTGGLPHAWMR